MENKPEIRCGSSRGSCVLTVDYDTSALEKGLRDATEKCKILEADRRRYIRPCVNLLLKAVLRGK